MTLPRALGSCLVWTLAGLSGVSLSACGGGGGSWSDATVDEAALSIAQGSATQAVLATRKPKDAAKAAKDAGAEVVRPVGGTEYVVVKPRAGQTVDQVVERLRKDPRVEDAGPDGIASIPEGGASTIPLFGDDPTSAVASQAAMEHVGVPAARGRATGAGVVVAVIDTGIAPHPLLDGRLAPGGRDFVEGDADPADGRNGLDDDLDGLIDEGFGHGTFVASLVLAVAPDARILPLRVLNSDAVGTSSGVANAIGYAVSRRVAVINLSLGTVTNVGMIRQAVQNARNAGVAVVAAAGNLGSDEVLFPAQETAAVAVTSVDDADVRPWFASYGPEIDLCAPGVDLVGAFPGAPFGTARWSGTSFSAALVSGGMALLRQRYPAVNAQGLLARLESTGVDVDEENPAYAGQLGGRVDLDAATR